MSVTSLVATLAALVALTGALAAGGEALTASTPPAKPPGIVIDYLPAKSKCYVGSPSIAILPDGSYVASHDIFGPGSTFNRTQVFASSDGGQSWKKISEVKGAFWNTLFVHRGALYLMGASKRYGATVIRRSRDGGKTWTIPKDAHSGLLLTGDFYHCAPQPVLVHKGRFWRAMEDNRGGPGNKGWGKHFRAFMMSAPEDADLLQATNWTCSNPIAREAKWLDGRFGGWLEGNAVAAPDGSVVNILRVEVPRGGGMAAIIRVSDDGKKATFDPKTGFVELPGGSTKFTIRYDGESRHYWSLANWIPKRHLDIGRSPGSTRNTLALIRSADLRTWEVRALVAYHPEVKHHGFQYPDWQFDGKDIIAAVRTAYDDQAGGAHNYHDANYLTFHRVADFRRAREIKLPPLPEPKKVTAACADFTVEGHGFEIATLTEGGLAYGNRKYVWRDVPEKLRGWRFTKTDGGHHAAIRVTAKQDTMILAATALHQGGTNTKGWQPVDGMTFHYTDKGRSKMTVFRRPLKAGETVEIPQTNWSGVVVLMPVPITSGGLEP